MCNCKPCRSLDLSVLVEILSGVDSDHGTGPRRNGSVNSRAALCPIERRSCLPKTLLQALIWLFTFSKLDNFFLLDLASIKTLLACSILLGCERQIKFLTKSESMKSATAFLPMSLASIRSLAMPGLAGTPKDKKYSSLSSKLELKVLVKPETTSSTRSTLHLSR